jgi:hypothetical protein
MRNYRRFGISAIQCLTLWLPLLVSGAMGAGGGLPADTQGEAAASERAVAVLMVTFPGQPAPAMGWEQVRKMLLETSAQRSGGEVFGWFRLDRVYGADEMDALRDAAIRAAGQAVDLRDYQRVVVLFPRAADGCLWWTLAGEEGEFRSVAVGDAPAGAAFDNVVRVAGTQPPTVAWVFPASGTGPAETFTFQYSDPDGYADLKILRANVNASTSLAGACAIEFDLLAGTIRLADDAGTGWLGPVAANQASTLQNSQCRILSASPFR